MNQLTSWEGQPLTLHVRDMAALLGLTRSTIWRRCGDRTMYPRPVSWAKPWMWNRDSVKKQLETPAEDVGVPRYFRKASVRRMKLAERASA